MSFEVKPVLHVCLDCHDKKFVFKDNTGVYDSALNEYGWEPDGTSPQTQIQPSDVVSSTLTITSPSGTSYGSYDVLSDIPTLDGVTYKVDLSDILGSGDEAAYEDGYWVFDWVVKGEYGVDDTPFQARCVRNVLVLCDVSCCVDTLAANIDPSCGCSDNGNRKWEMASLTLLTIQARDRKGMIESAKSMLERLKKICNNTCKSC